MFWLIWLLACDDNATEVGGLGVSPYPNAGGGAGVVVGKTWPAVQTILYSNCRACHTGEAGVGGFDLVLSSCEEITRVGTSYPEPLVKPGDHAGSKLWLKVSGAGATPDDGLMPPAGQMSEENIQTIADWIDDGAVCAPRYSLHDVQTIFDRSCVSCHAPGTDDPLDLTDAYATLLNGDTGLPSRYPSQNALIVRGHPESSFLMRKIIGYPFPDDGSLGENMPPDARLPADDIAVVFGWILDGASPE